MRRPRFVFTLGSSGIALLFVILVWAAAVRESPWRLARTHALWGGPLIEVRTPSAGDSLPPGGVPVLVRFPAEERSELNTFRCLLNDRDVTHLLTVGSNGAGGTVFPAPEGRNLLRVEVFGSSWLLAGFFQDSIEVSFEVEPRPSLNQG